MNLNEIEGVLKIIDREVWVLTASAGGRRGGLTATFVGPASIDRERPVLLAGIGSGHFTRELIDAAGGFVAHLLRTDQIGLAWNFADGSGRQRDKLAGLATNNSSGGQPILADCLAWCDCRVFTSYDAGDRQYYWADVVAAQRIGPGMPLREQQLITQLTDDQRRALAVSRQADVLAGQPLHEKWRTGTRIAP